MLIIQNNGKDVGMTNFWALPSCKEQFYMSFHVGAFRILLPSKFKNYLRDMKASKQLVITLGEYHSFNGKMAYEVLFDDHSNRPFCMTTTLDNADTQLSDADHGRKIELSVWLPESSSQPMKAQCVFRRKAIVRIGPILGGEAWNP